MVGTAKNDAVTALFTTSSLTNAVQVSDSVTDSSTTDSDTLTFDLAGDLFSAATVSAAPTVRNIENLVFNINTSSANLATDATYDNSATKLYVDGTTITGAQNYTFNVIKSPSGVTGASLKAATAGSTVTTDKNLSSLDVGTAAAGDAITIKMNSAGVPGTPATATVRNAAGDVTASGAGDFSLTATTATGAVNATAVKNLTISAAAAGVVMGSTTGGNATVTSTAATLIDISASGNVSITDSGAGSIKAVAGGTLTTAGTINATSMNLSSVGSSTLANATAVTSLTLAGNGAAATYNMGTLTAAANIQVTGASDVTLLGDSASLPATVTVTDTGTGTFTLRLNTSITTHDFGGGLIDMLRFDFDQGHATRTTTVASGQNITYTVDQGAAATLRLVGKPSSTNTSNAVTLILDDTVRDGSAVDIGTGGLLLTDIKTAVIDASKDTTSTGGANTISITAIDGSDEKANVTINGGINNITLAGTHTVGSTGTVTVNTSGAISFTGTLTAARLDASKSTGAVTSTTLSNATVREIYTGSAADTLTLNGVGNADIKTGAGNDVLTLDNDTYSSATAQAYTIDMGDGNDTLVMQSGTKFITGAGGTISLSGVETIRVLAAGVAGTDQIQASVLSGKTYNINASAAGATGALDVIVAATDTTVDLSTLNGSLATDSTIEGMTFNIDDSANSESITIKGMVNGKNTITGSSAGDVLTGGALADTFVYATLTPLFNSTGFLDTINGGAGNDIINLSATGTAYTLTNTTSWANVTSVEQITAAVNTAAISLTLAASAQTAGINRIDLSADTNAAVGNVVNVSAFTSAVTVVGSAGADTLTGGSGNDTFAASTSALLLADTIVGGDGTDTVLAGTLGSSPTGFDIVVGDSFAKMSGVEIFRGVAEASARSSVFGSTVYDAGIRTIDFSANTVSSVISIASITSASNGMTLIGSATGANTITGGAGNDVIIGGSGADSIVASTGSDTISTGAGADTVGLGNASTQTLDAGAGNDTITFGTGGSTVTAGAGDDSIALSTALVGSQTIIFGASASANGFDTITNHKDYATTNAVTAGAAHKLDFSAFLGAGYSVVGNDSVSTGITKVVNTGTADVNITSKVVVVDATAAAATLTATNIFNYISGTGNALAMSSGKAVVIADNNTHSQIFFIDAALDGVSGVSVADIVLVGQLSAATGQTWVTNMLAG